MFEVKVRSLRDQSLRTSCGDYLLVEGEVKAVTFKDLVEFESYQDRGVFLPVPDGTPESKNIPVVLPVPVPMKDGLPLVLHDGESELPLSNDPEDEPGVKILDSVPVVTPLDREGEGEWEETLPDSDLGPEEEEPEDEEDDSQDDVESWTNQIDHV